MAEKSKSRSTRNPIAGILRFGGATRRIPDKREKKRVRELHKNARQYC